MLTVGEHASVLAIQWVPISILKHKVNLKVGSEIGNGK